MKLRMIVLSALILWGCTHTRYLSQMEISADIEQFNSRARILNMCFSISSHAIIVCRE